MDGQRLFSEVEKVGAEFGSSVHYKKESVLMKVIAALIFLFNRRFMIAYTTTIGRRIYFPRRFRSSGEYLRGARTLAHELVHVEDYAARPVRFTLSYLMPQLLALLALVAIGAFWAKPLVWFLLALVFLLPFPAYWRMVAEVRGYTMTMAFDWWLGHRDNLNYEAYFKIFTGPGYYFMWPVRGTLRKQFESYTSLLEKGLLHQKIPVASSIQKVVVSSST